MTESSRYLRITLVLLAAMMSIIGSLGAPLIGTVAQTDHVTLSTAQWILTVTLLTGALATPIMGRLSDGHLQRRVVLFSLSFVMAGLIMAGLSRDFGWLLAGRALQGLGMGLLPATMTIARTHLTREEATPTIAALSVTAAVGIGLGYPLTSIITEYFGLHSAFWFAAILTGGVFTLAARVLPASHVTERRKFDVVGAGLLSVGLAAILILLGEGGVWGWASSRSILSAVCGVFFVGNWVWYELRRHDPLVNLRQSTHRAVVTADVSGFLMAVAMYLFMPVLVEFVQVPHREGYGFGSSVFTAGLLLVPLSTTTFIASRFVPMIVRHFNARVTIPLGAAIFAAAAMGFAIEHRALWEAFAAMGVAGLGAGLTYAAMPGYIVRASPAADTGAALGFYQLLRSVGLSIGSAMAGAIIAHYTRSGTAWPTIGGFTTTLWVAAALCLVTMFMSYFLLGESLHGSTSPEITEMMEENAELGATGFGLSGE